jgi:hypothetical protein
MSNATPQLFSNVSPSQFTLLTQKAQSAGIAISGNSGSASKMGVEVAWNYSPETEQLTLQCLKTPFFIKATDVNEKIHALVTQTLAAA